MARCHPFIRFSTPVTSGDSPFQGHTDHASLVGRHRGCGFSRNLADACGAALMRLDIVANKFVSPMTTTLSHSQQHSQSHSFIMHLYFEGK